MINKLPHSPIFAHRPELREAHRALRIKIEKQKADMAKLVLEFDKQAGVLQEQHRKDTEAKLDAEVAVLRTQLENHSEEEKKITRDIASSHRQLKRQKLTLERQKLAVEHTMVVIKTTESAKKKLDSDRKQLRLKIAHLAEKKAENRDHVGSSRTPYPSYAVLTGTLCVVCQEPMVTNDPKSPHALVPICLNEGHSVCANCNEQLLQHSNNECPLCRGPRTHGAPVRL